MEVGQNGGRESWVEGVKEKEGERNEGRKEGSIGGGNGQMRSVLGTPQVRGHFITFLVDQTTVDTFFAHQQD